jgi:hypothetical protein
MTTFEKAASQIQHVAILSVWTFSSGRCLVRFRGPRTVANPSGIQVAHTALLTTPEGQSTARALRRRERTGPMSLLRTTPVELTVETLPDGSTLRLISPAQPAPAS